MKKIFLTLFTFAVVHLSAQNLHDALRYSKEGLEGTARFKALSGAFGAIGGDFSATAQNPAGGAIFSSSEMSFSFGDFSKKQSVDFFGTNTTQVYSDFTANQFGLILNISNSSLGNWKRINFVFNYQSSQNFNIDGFSAKGSTNNNLGAYFANFANGISQQNLLLVNYKNKVITERYSLSDIYNDMGRASNPFRYRNALLGHYTGMINPEIGRDEIYITDSDETAHNILNEKKYISNTGENTTVVFEKFSEGKVNKYNFNLSGQYGDNLYLGLNLNSHSLDYTEKTVHNETYTTSNGIRSANFENTLHAFGKGFSFQMGIIAKADANWRFGASYHSPTWYTIQEKFSQKLQTTTVLGQTIYANPLVTAIYPEYKFRSPSSWQGSVAYIFGKKGFINIDYIYKGYKNLSFSSENLRYENNIIEQELGDTSQIRIGGEYRLKQLSLRGGYRFSQSPFRVQNKYIGNINGFSVGAGYTFGGTRVDISYDIANQNNQLQLYENVINTPHSTKSTHQNLLFTISTKIF